MLSVSQPELQATGEQPDVRIRLERPAISLSGGNQSVQRGALTLAKSEWGTVAGFQQPGGQGSLYSPLIHSDEPPVGRKRLFPCARVSRLPQTTGWSRWFFC